MHALPRLSPGPDETLRVSSGVDLAGALRARAMRLARSVLLRSEVGVQRSQAALPTEPFFMKMAAPPEARLRRADTAANRSNHLPKEQKGTRARGAPDRSCRTKCAAFRARRGARPSADRLRVEPQSRECLHCSLLLCGLLRRSTADAELLAVDARRAREAPIMRRPFRLDDLVLHRAALPRKRLLQLRLVVDEARERVVDPAGERGDDRALD